MNETYYRITPTEPSRIRGSDISPIAIFNYVAFVTATRQSVKPRLVGGKGINDLVIAMPSSLEPETIKTLKSCVNVERLAREPKLL